MKISEATSVTSPAGTELVPVDNSGAPGCVSVAVLRDYIVAAVRAILGPTATQTAAETTATVLANAFSASPATAGGTTSLVAKSDATTGVITLSQVLAYIQANLPGITAEQLNTITSAVKSAFYSVTATTTPAGTDVLALRTPQSGANPAADKTLTLASLLAYVLANLPGITDAQMATIKAAVKTDLFAADAASNVANTAKLAIRNGSTDGTVTLSAFMALIRSYLNYYVGTRTEVSALLDTECFLVGVSGDNDRRISLSNLKAILFGALASWLNGTTPLAPSFNAASSDKLLVVRTTGGVPEAHYVPLPDFRTALLSGESSTEPIPGVGTVSVSEPVAVLDNSSQTAATIPAGARVRSIRYYVSEAVSVTDVTDENTHIPQTITPVLKLGGTTVLTLGSGVTSVAAGTNGGDIAIRELASDSSLSFELGFSETASHAYAYAGRITVAVAYETLSPLTE